MRLGVEEWERWTTWVGLRCGAVASALLRLSRDTAEALSEIYKGQQGALIIFLCKVSARLGNGKTSFDIAEP